MNKKWQAPLKRTLALLLCVASLLGMFPTVLRQEANAASESYRDRTTAVNGAVTVDGKQVAYMGETVYNVSKSTSVAAVLQTISRNITVFNPADQDVLVPYDKDSNYGTGNTKEGYYSFYLPDGFDANTSGSYEVGVVYNGKNKNTVIGTVTLNVSGTTSSILGMSGLRDHDTAVEGAASTSASTFYLEPIPYNTSFWGDGAPIAIRSVEYGSFMSYDPYQPDYEGYTGLPSTGSFVYDDDGNSLGTIYEADFNSSTGLGNFYMDHSLRNDALWLISQPFNKTTGKVTYGSHTQFWYVGKNESTDGVKGYTYKVNGTTKYDQLQPYVGGEYVFPSIHLQKGGTTWDRYDFWYHAGDNSAFDTTNPTYDNTMFRHLYYLSDSGPFARTAQWDVEGASNAGKLGKFFLEVLSDGRCMIYYREAMWSGGADFRVLTCDSTGKWSVKRYLRSNYDNNSDKTLQAMKDDPENYVRLYRYKTESTTKQVSYKGYTVYNVMTNTSLADLKSAIYSNLTVFDNQRRNQFVPGETQLKGDGQNKSGYYWLRFPSDFSTSTPGSHDVEIVYNSLANDSGSIVNDVVGKVKVNIQEVTYTASTNAGVVSKNAGAHRNVYATANSETGVYITVSVGNQSTRVPVTLGMLSKNGESVDTSAAGPQTGLTLTYMGQTISTNFTLNVYDGTLDADHPQYPEPGSVVVNKISTTQQDTFYNGGNGNGVANIQLSTKGKNSVLGVDLVIVIDQSSSMKYSLDSNTDAADTVDDPSRLTVLKDALNTMITKMQADNLDVRIALADFGDLDHYEFTNAVLDTAKRNWPQVETYIQDPEAYSSADGTTCYKINYNYDPPNHLNFVLGNDRQYTDYNSQPFALHYTKYDDESGCNFTGKLLPYIYTGTNKIEAEAFVDVNDLSNVELTKIFRQIDIQNDKALGTNYDVGLEYAYRLAYARKVQNQADRENRMVSVIFMSDGAAMQYNYFSGRSQVESWSQYLIGNTDELLFLKDENGNYTVPANNPQYHLNISNTSGLHPNVSAMMTQMHQQLSAGTLKKLNGNAAEKCNHVIGKDATASNFISCYKSKTGTTLTLGSIIKLIKVDGDLSVHDGKENVKGDAAVREIIRRIRMNSNSNATYSTYSPYSYFYNLEGKNWWAEAIKGDANQIFPVVDRHQGKNKSEAEGGKWNGDFYQGVSITASNKQNVPDYMMESTSSAKNYITGFPGLGINIYTIGFAITADDNQISAEEAKTVLRNVATTQNMFYDAEDAAALTNAFNDIISRAVTSASNAYMTDTMGQQYDLLTGANMEGKGVPPEITLKEYYVNSDGTRGELVKTWETITFGANGVASSDLKSGDIWADDGGIRGEYIYYNANTDSALLVENIRGTGRNFTLQPETFFWSIGDIGETELVLEYQVYLNGSTEHTLPNGENTYDTNKEAILHYTDELNNWIHLSTVSPAFKWRENPPKVAYKFYLVDASGNPVGGTSHINATQVGIAGEAQLEVDPNADSKDKTLTASKLLATAKVDTDRVELYSGATSVKITSLTAVQNHTATITDGEATKTTYMTYVENGTTTSATASDEAVSGYNVKFAGATIYFAVKLKNCTVADTVVVDYGLPVNIDVLGNDSLTKGELQGYAPNGDVPGADMTAPTDFTTGTLTLTYGSVTKNSNATKWTPAVNMQMDGYDRFLYCAKDTEDGVSYYYYNTVTVIPATSIYYEDNFVTFATGDLKTNGWSWATWTNKESDDTDIGTPITGTQNNNASGNGNYGYDSAYKHTTTYSGEAFKATVFDKKPARATFTFTGTGFDVISKTGITTGAITVSVYKGVPSELDDPSTSVEVVDSKGNITYKWENLEGAAPIKTFLVETYYSLSDIYQVPVIKCEDLDYGTYTVEILVAYDEWFAKEHPNGQFDFYLDAIRIYNPAGTNPTGVIGSQYATDHESWPRYRELRSLMLDANVDIEYKTATVKDENGNPVKDKDGKDKTMQMVSAFKDKAGAATQVPGILFIDSYAPGGNTGINFSKYTSWGPNNEIYLKEDQTIAFTLNITDYQSSSGGNVQKVQIAMRSLDGKKSTVTLNGKLQEISATDMYYTVVDFGNGSASNQTVTVKAGSGAKVAISTIKLTHKNQPGDYHKLSGTVSKSQTKRAVVEESNTLNVNPESMKSLITVDVDMANELLDQLNKDLAAPAVITPKYASLSFKDLIHTNIYFTADKLAGIDAANLGLAVFADHAVDGTVDTASYVVNGAALVDGMYKVSTQGIPAKNLGDTIYFKVFAKEADGSYTYSNLMTYSPLEYANFLIESGSDMDKTLAAAMLNYGAEAQKYFGYKADTLMNANVTAEAQALLNSYSISDLDAMDAIDETKVGAFAATEGFTKKYPSVTFKGAFQINYYFEPAVQVDGDMTFYYWTEDTCNAVTELTADNADGTAVMTAENGVYTAISGPIFAKNLDSTIYVAAVYESDGQTCCTGILPYSVAEYARAFADGTDDFAPFAKAVGIYGSVAKAYFGN